MSKMSVMNRTIWFALGTALAVSGSLAQAQVEPKREAPTVATPRPTPEAPLPLPHWRVQEARALLNAITASAATA